MTFKIKQVPEHNVNPPATPPAVFPRPAPLKKMDGDTGIPWSPSQQTPAPFKKLRED